MNINRKKSGIGMNNKEYANIQSISKKKKLS